MTATVAALLAELDVDRLTDVVGLVLAAALLGLLALVDLDGLDAERLPVPPALTQRRTLVVASVVVGLVLAVVVVARIAWLAG